MKERLSCAITARLVIEDLRFATASPWSDLLELWDCNFRPVLAEVVADESAQDELESASQRAAWVDSGHLVVTDKQPEL